MYIIIYIIFTIYQCLFYSNLQLNPDTRPRPSSQGPHTWTPGTESWMLIDGHWWSTISLLSTHSVGIPFITGSELNRSLITQLADCSFFFLRFQRPPAGLSDLASLRSCESDEAHQEHGHHRERLRLTPNQTARWSQFWLLIPAGKPGSVTYITTLHVYGSQWSFLSLEGKVCHHPHPSQ